MRRFSHDKSWGFAPVLNTKAPFPKRLPMRLKLKPTSLTSWFCFERMDVIIGRRSMRFRSSRLWQRGKWQRIDKKDFIGVAVRRSYSADSDLFSGLKHSFGQLLEKLSARISLSPGSIARLQGSNVETYTLYLLHEELPMDLMIYQSTDDLDITALWQFWSERLSLPKLLVDHVGFIHEPDMSPNTDQLFGAGVGAGPVALRRVYERPKRHQLKGRRPVFGRVRPVGVLRSVPRFTGREIVART